MSSLFQLSNMLTKARRTDNRIQTCERSGCTRSQPTSAIEREEEEEEEEEEKEEETHVV
jgi:hypothetical protein